MPFMKAGRGKRGNPANAGLPSGQILAIKP